MIPVDLKNFQIPIHLESRSFLRFFIKGMTCLSVQSVVLWPFDSTSSFNQSLCLCLSVGSPEHYSSLYLDDQLIVSASFSLLKKQCQILLQLCNDLEIVISWEKYYLKLKTWDRCLGMLVDTNCTWENVHNKLQDHRIPES